MSKLVINIDSTSLAHSGCPLAFIRTVVGDIQQPDAGAYREKCLSVNLVYGIAVHAFIDMMYKTGGHFPTARDKAKKLFEGIPFYPDKKKLWMNDWKHVLITCNQVWTEFIEPNTDFELFQIQQKCWKCEHENLVIEDEASKFNPPQVISCTVCSGARLVTGPASEVNFKIKYFENEFLIVYLCGTIDRLGKFKGGVNAIRDWKTTGSWDTDGYFEQYELARQLRFYKLAMQLMAKLKPDSVLGQVGLQNSLGVAIDGIFLAANANETKVITSPVYQIHQIEIDRFEKTLQDFILELSSYIERNYFPKNGILNGSCEKKFSKSTEVYSKCAFWHCCKSTDEVSDVLLSRDFKRVQFNPLEYNK